ncbi:hypothetical protein K474DRAFT_1559807, partial [Panus rudis PR-1116 ss-1]
LEGYVEINGIKAFTLFDSGSTFDSLSPALAKVAGLEEIELEDPVTLQMAVKGSTSKVNYGTYARCRIGPIDTKHYFDISNIDHYQCILGMPFMHTHNVMLAPGTRRIHVG